MTKTKRQRGTVLRREALSGALDMCKAGLSDPDKMTVPQSDCYCFKGGSVYTYNDEVCCRGPSGLPEDLEAAVASAKLAELLRKLDDEELTVVLSDGEFTVRVGRKASGFKTQPEVTIPVDDIPVEGEWTPLPDDFIEAMHKVHVFASRDEKDTKFVCVNIHPEWVEATDAVQVCRWSTNTGFSRPVMINRRSAAGVAASGACSFIEAENWVHFRNKMGFVLSCRRWDEAYPSESIGKLLAQPGTPLDLPKELAEATDKAGLFSAGEKGEDDLIDVAISKDKPGKEILISGLGRFGWYSEYLPAVWAGPDVRFMISPLVLADIAKSYSSATLTHTTLRVETGPCRYATRLTLPQEEDGDGDRGEGDDAD